MQSPAERHYYILERLRARGFVTVSDLGRDLDVSEATIRRDLRRLEERDLLFRTHGGANPPSHLVYDRPVTEKAKQHATEKERVGRAAAAMVQENDSIILGSGTTVMQVAKHLNPDTHVTVLTSAINVAMELSRHPAAELIQLGGMVRHTSTSAVGPMAETMLSAYSCRKLFLGVDGLDLAHGLSTSNPLEASLNQRMIAAAQEIIVVTDSSKFGLRGFSQICPLEQVDKIVTDDQLPAATVKLLEDRGLEVLCV
ncbi:MAG: DeoR family transcriptional regulator of aga operon [Rhodothermales bacterium]|jgi:DeoR family transcriptional regulator of aga operon